MFSIPTTYTVESVTSGHPDKVCDQISDAVLDACLLEDPMSRVALESFGGHGLLVLGGEVTTAAHVDYAGIGRRVYHEIGYTDELEVITRVAEQSREIAQGVDAADVSTVGAGDQGIMYGFATNGTPTFMPQAVAHVHALTHGLEMLRRSGELPWLRPDGKAQITYRDGTVRAVLVSTQHAEGIAQDELRASLIEKLIHPTLGNLPTEQIFTNPTGSFVVGGFFADTGLTGRKIMIDTYCGLVPHGGGAFSGKDATKVDRSAAYMCRFVAKNLVANGYAKQCLVSVAYAIGMAEPLMVEAVDETGKSLADVVAQHFDFRPGAIIERLGLRKPIFHQTATYGHFGKEGLPWEEVVKI